MKKIQTDNSSSDLDKAIAFVLKKGVLDNNFNKDVVILRLRDPNICSNHVETRHYQSAQKRLMGLVQNEEIHTNTIPQDLHMFDESEFPGYDKNNLFFCKYPKSLVQRQSSGLCYMTAPAMVQHYLLSKNNELGPMIDILNLVQTNFTAKMLERHIFDDDGWSRSIFELYLGRWFCHYCFWHSECILTNLVLD